MPDRIVECVANFSEGRNLSVIRAITGSVSAIAGVALLHVTSDPDHNRSVLTFAGTPDAVKMAALRAISAAVEYIDLNSHAGIHPRIGAADVVPLVPVRGITLPECARLAQELGEEIWDTLRVPVYFYGAAAKSADRIRLENVRRGNFEGLREALRTDRSRAPDVGGPELHPTAGAVIVGARKVLIAWNVNLQTDNLSVAMAIARTIRASSGGFPHVKALGLPLPSRGQVQVSVNLTDYEQTPMHSVYEAICAEATRWNVKIAGTEIIGLIPRGALERAAEAYFGFENFAPDLVLETRIGALS